MNDDDDDGAIIIKRYFLMHRMYRGKLRMSFKASGRLSPE